MSMPSSTRSRSEQAGTFAAALIVTADDLDRLTD